MGDVLAIEALCQFGEVKVGDNFIGHDDCLRPPQYLVHETPGLRQQIDPDDDIVAPLAKRHRKPFRIAADRVHWRVSEYAISGAEEGWRLSSSTIASTTRSCGPSVLSTTISAMA